MSIALEKEIKTLVIKDKFRIIPRQVDNRPVWVTKVSIPCPVCGALEYWTFPLEPDLWRCANCHPWELSERIVERQAHQTHIPVQGECYACFGAKFWQRPDSELGGKGGLLCRRCHPQPGTEKEE